MAPGGHGDGRKAPERDRILKRPCSETTASGGAAGWRSMMLAMTPLPDSTDTPCWRRRENVAMASMMSGPPAMSSTYDHSALGLSHVMMMMMMGDLGLFVEPRGLWRGRLMDEKPPLPLDVPELTFGVGEFSPATAVGQSCAILEESSWLLLPMLLGARIEKPVWSAKLLATGMTGYHENW
jgi:hypothetical protein